MPHREVINKVWHFALFNIGGTTITTAIIITFLAILIALIVAARILTRMFSAKVLSRFHIDEATRYTFERVMYYVLLLIGIIVDFNFIGISLSGLAVIFGLLSVGIGFGLQNVTSNFVAGLILLFERPIKVNDRITIGGTEGDVIAINMRSTTVLSLNNIAIIVPNSEFVSKQVTNWSYSDKRVRLEIDVGVSYGSELETVIRCLREVALENKNVLKTPEPSVLLLSFGNSSWNMRLRCWIEEAKGHWEIRSELNCDIVRKFRANNVEIPFPQRDIHLRSAVLLPIAGPQENRPESQS